MGNLQIGEQFKVKTGIDGLNLRWEATTSSKTKDGKKDNFILSIPNGTKVTLESIEVKTVDKRTWYNVKYTDKDKKELKGWVASDYLEDLLFPIPTLSWLALYDNLPNYHVYPCIETKGLLFSVGSDRVGELNLPINTLREKLPKKLSEKVPEKVSEKVYENVPEKVSDNLRKQFQKHSITLSPTAEAEVITTGISGTKWKIVDGNQMYLILTENQTVNAYRPAFENQCAIRMGISLEKSGVDLSSDQSSFQGEKCWQGHSPKHILRAQELADWLTKQTRLVGKVKIISKSDDPSFAFKGKKGIVFFQNITETKVKGIDHIDVFDGVNLKNGCEKLKDVPDTKWVDSCQQVWFWDLRPCTAKTDVNVHSEKNVNSTTVQFTPDPGQPLEFGREVAGWTEVKMKGVKLGFTETSIFIYDAPVPVVKGPSKRAIPNANGVPLEVVAVQENWVQIRSNGKLGFIERRNVVIPDQYLVA